MYIYIYIYNTAGALLVAAVDEVVQHAAGHAGNVALRHLPALRSTGIIYIYIVIVTIILTLYYSYQIII